MTDGAVEETRDDDEADEAIEVRLAPKSPKTFFRPLDPDEIDLTFGAFGGLDEGRKKSG